MKTKVTIEGRDFYINYRKKTVTCRIKANCNILDSPYYDFISSVIGGWRSTNMPKSLMIENLYGNKEFVAVARCSPQDKFNEVKGKRIAESRAKTAAFKYFEEQFRKCSVVLAWAGVGFKTQSRACKYAKETEYKHLKKLLEC